MHSNSYFSLKTSIQMEFTPSKLNTFLLVKLPSAFLCGVRVREISPEKCVVTVRHRWISQNPFNSMYFAVQAMAAELTTGALMMYAIRDSRKNISMLVANNRSTFTKKARGKITFTCDQGLLVRQAVEAAVSTGEGQTIWLTSVGVDEAGDKVSEMSFEWTIKLKGTAKQ